MKIDIDLLMQRLASQRPVFHSEADFQHAFAWQIANMYPELQVRLEVPLRGMHGRGSLDIVIRDGSSRLAIELKYCKARLETSVDGEEYSLPATVARDIFRHDVCKDIWRLEHAVGSGQAETGWMILLCNDEGLWKTSARSGIDDLFKLHHGRELSGVLTWDERAGAGTTKKRDTPLALHNTYNLNWQEYSDLAVRNGRFRYLAVPVHAGEALDLGSVPEFEAKGAVPKVDKRAEMAVYWRDRSNENAFTLTFDQVAEIIGPLPPSAFNYNAWWHHVASHPHAVWELEGFKASPSLDSRTVTFRRAQ